MVRAGVGTLTGLVAGALGAGLVGPAVSPAHAAVAAAARIGGAQLVNANQAVTFHAIGSVNGQTASHQTFTLQYHLGGSRWRTVGSKQARKSGQLEWVVRVGRTSNWRVVMTTDSGARTASAWHRVVVRAASRGNQVVSVASRHRGKPYRFGAAGPSAFDCSGFTQYVYKSFGKRLPHSATQQARHGRAVSKGAKRPGDLILFGSGGRYHHAAIYAGGNYMWDAATTGKPVAKRKIWSNTYVVRRLV